MSKPAQMMVCDFCLRPSPQWSFPTRDFSMPTGLDNDTIIITPVGIIGLPKDIPMIGNWAACAGCHGLIVCGDRERLARRAAKSVAKRKPHMCEGIPLSIMTRDMRTLHDEFWCNREGRPTSINSVKNPS